MTLKLTTALLATGVLSLAACSGSEDTGDKPVISSFTAAPAMLSAGESTTLSWAVTGVDAASISITAGAANVTTSTDLSGNVEFTVQETTTFVLVATAGTETAMKSVTVTVRIDPDALAILGFSATPNPAPVGGMTTLAYMTQNATGIKIKEGATEIFSGTTANGTQSVTLTAASHTYTLEATDGTDTVMDTVTVTTEALGAVMVFTVTPQTFMGASQDVTVTWAATGATFTLTANGAAVAGFNGAAAGTQMVNITDTTAFVFTAIGAGTTDSRMATVTKAVGEAEPNNDRATATAITGGASAAITPGDVDYYSFSVVEGGYVIAETSDGMGGCPGDTVIALWDSAGMDALGSDDDGGEGVCSRIDGAADDFARNLPAGTYYIAVNAFSDTATIAAYTLSLQAGAPGCGNNIKESAEQCDDGNMTAGDGCDTTCQLELTIDGTVTTAGTFETFTASLGLDETRLYEVTVAAASTIRVETGVATLGQCTAAMGAGSDTVVTVFDASFTQVARNDDGGVGLCSLAGADVEAGTYYVQVEELGQNSLIPTFEVSIAVLPQGCGNTLLDMGEDCDDGNATAGDGCSATCTFDPSATLANPGGMASGTLQRPGLPETVLAALTIADGETVTATTGACTTPNAIGLLAPDGMGGTQLVGTNFPTAPDICAGFDPTRDGFAVGLNPGTYYVIGVATSAAGPVSLTVGITAPACGNGITEGSEQCDDGNMTPGDGCDANCQVEGLTAEVEPNDTNATATPIPGATGTGFGLIDPVGDHDVYAITVGANEGVTATTYTVGGDPTTCQGADTLIELRDSADVLLVDNDDGGAGLCSAISPTVDTAAGNLAAGTYYIVVRHFNDGAVTANYFLDISIQ